MPAHPILELRNVSKAFPGVQALQRASFAVERGEVHALLGGNGAGKSTIVNIVAGHFAPDDGEVVIDGCPVRLHRPRDSIAQGISVIFQELFLVPDLSVAENIFLGRLPRRSWATVDWRELDKQAEIVLRRLGLAISPRAMVGELSTGVQQQVEIARAITAAPKILVMDEPTSALTAHEIDRLFEVVDTLKAQGITLIFISHNLDEVWRISDRMTVLRDGKVVLTCATGEMTPKRLAEAMVGHELRAGASVVHRERGEAKLVLKGLTNRHLANVSLEVGRGEVVGLAGALGAGRSELLHAIFGLDALEAGEVFLEGRPCTAGSPRAAIRQGVYLVPEDRKTAGLILSMSVAENITLPYAGELSVLGFVSRKRRAEITGRYVDQLGIKTPSLRQRVLNLSGGNQQKVVLARWMSMKPEVLLLDQPTRGLDVHAKEEVYALMRRLAGQGVAILFAATELAELIQVCDRIYALRSGEIVREFPVAAACTEQQILLASIADDHASDD
jgi:ribose transport system ATP-binding protein